jgi:hypothetical protein
MKSKNAHIWKAFNWPPEDHKMLDAIMAVVLPVVKKYKKNLHEIPAAFDDVVLEAIYQVTELPKETKEIQEENKWKP